jgi:preprotein translocase subunit SecY
MSASSSSNDLRNRILFTIFILAVYRFGTFVPLTGIDHEQLTSVNALVTKRFTWNVQCFAGEL